jgi:hypothetical protein
MERSKTTFIIFDGQFLEMPLSYMMPAKFAKLCVEENRVG